jgi:hypothetical protein
MKILIKTNPQGKIEIFDQDGGRLTNIGRVDIYVNSHGKPSAIITFKDVELDIEVDYRK